MSHLEKIHCPTCDKANTWHADNPYRPFCSDRCKLIDLGEWANESRAIAGEPLDFNELPSDSKSNDFL